MKASPLIVYLPDTRGVQLSRYGMGNMKIGLGVFTYSRLPGRPAYAPIGSHGRSAITQEAPSLDIRAGRPGTGERHDLYRGTCPGSTPECESICYAGRPVAEYGPVSTMWAANTARVDVPEIPAECTVLRLHVSGDFDCVEYINNWIVRLQARPDVTMWVYTRSWRVPELAPALERLRALPNVQVFASMDKSTPDLPATGWRRAWIDEDTRAGQVLDLAAHTDEDLGGLRTQATFDGVMTYVCPEETKHKKDCLSCGYCFEGKKNDVTFLRH